MMKQKTQKQILIDMLNRTGDSVEDIKNCIDGFFCYRVEPPLHIRYIPEQKTREEHMEESYSRLTDFAKEAINEDYRKGKLPPKTALFWKSKQSCNGHHSN